MKKRILLIPLALLLAMSLVAIGCPPQEPEEDVAPPVVPIRLGAVNPLGDITGEQATKAMELAVEEINAAGGVLGRPLELIVVDSEFNPAKGAAAIDKLAEVDKVDIFIGGLSSGVHLAQIPKLKKYEKVTVWMGAASHKVEEAIAGNDWYFHLHPWDYQQGEGFVEGWAAIAEEYPQIKMDRQFIAYEEGGFGSAAFTASKALFVDVTLEGESFTSAAFGGGDYSAVLRHAEEFNPDIFVWVGYGADALPIMTQAKEAGFAPPVFLGSPPGWPVGFGESPLSDAVFLYAMWAPALKEVSPVARHFWDAYIEKWGEEPVTYFAPLGYTNIKFVAEGIRKAGTLEREALIEALREIELETALGETLTISPSKLIKHQGFTKQKILQWQGGEQQVIWPFEFATAEPIYPFPGWGER